MNCIYSGVLIGLLAMGEPLPATFSMKLVRLLSWLVTIVGVSALANGKGPCLLASLQHAHNEYDWEKELMDLQCWPGYSIAWHHSKIHFCLQEASERWRS